MIGEIEQVHRARDVEIAVRIVLAGELDRVVLEIGLDFEVDAERIPRLALHGRALAAETQGPLLGGPVRDHAELASQPHPLHGDRIERIVSVVPGRILADDLPLQ